MPNVTTYHINYDFEPFVDELDDTATFDDLVAYAFDDLPAGVAFVAIVQRDDDQLDPVVAFDVDDNARDAFAEFVSFNVDDLDLLHP